MNLLLPAYTYCILNGAIVTSLLAIALVPVIALFASRTIAAHIARMQDDPLWQAPLAACATILPGTLFLIIAATGLVSGWNSPCMQVPVGKALYAGLALITAAAITRGLFVTVTEVRIVSHLRSRSHAASKRLSAIAARAGITALEIDAQQAVFALVGIVRPVAIVSTAVLSRLSDEQLYAGLCHEAAHRDRHDGLFSLMLVFFSNVLPVRPSAAAAIYHQAREVAADYLAVQDSNRRFDLARAITVMARAGCSSMPALSGDGDIHTRVHRLIEDCRNTPQAAPRAAVLVSLASTAAFGFAPLAVVALQLLSCTGVTAR